MYLTRAEQTTIGETIEAHGIPLAKIEREGFGNKETAHFTLCYSDKPSYRFEATKADDDTLGEPYDYVYNYRPNENPDPRETPSAAEDFNELVRKIAHWVDLIVEEEDPVDPWQVLLNPVQRIKADDNTPLDQTELAVVLEWLKATEKKLLENAKTNHEEIIERIAALEEGAKKFGRKDFCAMVVGSIFSLALGAVVTPDAVRTAIESFQYLAVDSLRYYLP